MRSERAVLLVFLMGVKGLSAGVIKQAWRPAKLSDFAGKTVGVDADGLLHKAVISNAMDVVLERPDSTRHHNTFISKLQPLIHVLGANQTVLVFSGAPWPLKAGTHAKRRNSRFQALDKAQRAHDLGDSEAAQRHFRAAVKPPDAFLSWVIEHAQSAGCTVVVAPYEADQQLAYMQANGLVDVVYSAAEDSDFLVYGMDTIIYDLRADLTCKVISVHSDVIGKEVGGYHFESWSFSHFRVWSAACGCDYVDNPPKYGCKKLYGLVNNNLDLTESELCSLIAEKASDHETYKEALCAAVMSFKHAIINTAAALGFYALSHRAVGGDLCVGHVLPSAHVIICPLPIFGRLQHH